MKMRLAFIGLCMLAFGGCGVQPELLAMRKITSPEGWPGTAFYSNGALESEELDTTGRTGIVDLWRYYEKGVLVRQFSDRNRDGQIDEKKFYDDDGVLVIIQSDTNYDGTFDFNKDLRVKTQPQTGGGSMVDSNVSAGKGNAENSGTDNSAPLTAEDIFGNSTAQPPVTENTPTTPVIINEPDAGFDRAPAPNNVPGPQTPGSIVQPITPPSNLVSPSAARNGNIVPGPTFAHPSAGLEE